MQHFSSDGTDIAFFVEGEGAPILLIHGFASTAAVNWVEPGWVDTLVKAGRRVVAFDDRGHGKSQKLYDPSAYDLGEMAEDARRLLDHLGIERADVMGYSMGARIAARFAIRHPERVNTLIIGGLAEGLFAGISNRASIAAALEAPGIGDVPDDAGRAFRGFAERTGSDLKALAACIRGESDGIDPAALAALPMPILFAVGTRDSVAGSIEAMAERVPNAEVLRIPNRDHMSAVGDKTFKEGVIAFLARATVRARVG